MLATEQNAATNGQAEGSDVYHATLKSLGACETTLQRMQAIEKLHDVSLKVIEAMHHVTDSEMELELKSKAFSILQRVSDNASYFEKLVTGRESTARPQQVPGNGQRRIG